MISLRVAWRYSPGASILPMAVAVAVIGALFTALGYVPNATQSAVSQEGIVWLMSFVPAVFSFLAVVCMFFYDLDAKKLVRIQSDLLERKTARGA